jgi:hypothetical protein
MTTSLRNTIHELAQSFAASVLDAIRGAPLEEILVATGGGVRSAKAAPVARGGRLERRSVEDIAGLVAQIVTLLEGAPGGLRAEQIRSALGLEAKELPRPLADALAQKRITKSGEKRATTYFARTAKKAAAATKKAKKKAAPKAPAKPKAKKLAKPAPAPVKAKKVKAKAAKPSRVKAPTSVPALEQAVDGKAEAEIIDAELLPDGESEQPEELELEPESAEEPGDSAAEDASAE